MGFIINSKFRAVFVLAFIVGIGLTTRAFAQDSVSAEAADTVSQVVDTVAAATDSVVDESAASTDTEAAAPKVAATSTAAAAVEESGPDIDPQVYMNFFYGVLLVFLICVLIAVIGTILQVYELTRRMNGRDTTYSFRNFILPCLVLSTFIVNVQNAKLISTRITIRWKKYGQLFQPLH